MFVSTRKSVEANWRLWEGGEIVQRGEDLWGNGFSSVKNSEVVIQLESQKCAVLRYVSIWIWASNIAGSGPSTPSR